MKTAVFLTATLLSLGAFAQAKTQCEIETAQAHLGIEQALTSVENDMLSLRTVAYDETNRMHLQNLEHTHIRLRLARKAILDYMVSAECQQK